MSRALLPLLVGLCAPALAQSGSLTTGQNGAMSEGNVFYFDVVASQNLTITSLQVHLENGNPGATVQIHRREGTALGFEDIGQGWSLAATGTAPNAQPMGTYSDLVLDQPFVIPPGRTGLALVYSGDNQRYGDGLFPLGRLLESNADLEIYEGSVGTAFLNGRCCAPRAWEGTIRYDIGGSAPIGSNYCGARPNSTFMPADISAVGSNRAVDNDLTVNCGNLPTNTFGLLITSRTQGLTFNPGGSQGDLCLAGAIGRFNSLISDSGATGTIAFPVNLTAVPEGPAFVSVMPGQTWNFQCWYRDVNPTATSNFTNGVEIMFN